MSHFTPQFSCSLKSFGDLVYKVRYECTKLGNFWRDFDPSTVAFGEKMIFYIHPWSLGLFWIVNSKQVSSSNQVFSCDLIKGEANMKVLCLLFQPFQRYLYYFVFSVQGAVQLIASFSPKTFRDFGIRRKLILFSLPQVNFTAAKCTLWRKLMKV